MLTPSIHNGEDASNVIKHVLYVISYFGVPHQIKTDNGSAYISESLRNSVLYGMPST